MPPTRAFLRLLASFALLLLATRAASAAPGLAERVQRIDRESAGRLASLAASAARQGQGRLAQKVYERVIEWDPEHAAARKELGFVKGAKGWTRAKTPAPPEPPAGAESAAQRQKLEADVLAVETARGEQVVAACAAANDRAAARPFLEALLERLPRLESAHAALGHEKVEGRWVRPALVDLARRQKQLLASWTALRTPPLPAEPAGETLQVPGVPDLAWWKVGKRWVTGSYPPEVVKRRAAETECVHQLLGAWFGPAAAQFDPPRVAWFTPPHFEAFVKSRHPEAGEQQKRLRSSNYLGSPFALRSIEVGAADIYAHNVAFFTAQTLASPALPDDPKRRNLDVHAWWKEGLGYLATLVLWDTGTTSFFSDAESNAKSKGVLPPPSVQSDRALLDWMRQVVLRREAYDLREVLGTSLNALDFVGSIEAATWVRFLALYDPAAFQRLPGALRAESHGSGPERVEAALVATYGKGIDDLGTLWRAWLLEVA